jgi:hypothetical protein
MFFSVNLCVIELLHNDRGTTALRFARWLFLIAGVYGLLATISLYFTEIRTGIDYPPPVTHPEFFYGFAGVTAAWQVLFLIISRNPIHYRAIMPVCALEKAAMLVIILILLPQGRFPANWYPAAAIDIALGVLFLIAFFRLSREQRSAA